MMKSRFPFSPLKLPTQIVRGGCHRVGDPQSADGMVLSVVLKMAFYMGVSVALPLYNISQNSRTVLFQEVEI